MEPELKKFFFSLYLLKGVLSLSDYVTPEKEISFQNFKWLNEPASYEVKDNKVTVITDNETDFWQETWYNFTHNTGHLYGVDMKEDFCLTVCIEADFTTLYDQAGLMIYVNEKQWLKAGIEYNDGQPMMSSVHTNGVSDWAAEIEWWSRDFDINIAGPLSS